MKFSVFTASTPEWTPEEAAATLAAQGWDGIEWRITDQEPAAEPGFWAGNRSTWALTGLEKVLARIAAVTSAAGLEYSGIGGYVRCDNHDDVERILAATAHLGAGQVRIVVLPLGASAMGGEPTGRDYRDLFAETREHFAWVAERSSFHGVKALVELHHQTVTSSPSSALRLLEGLDPNHVGVIHDLGNLVVEGGEESLAGLQLLGDYLAHVHVKNAAWRQLPGTGAESAWKHEWSTLRGGIADVPRYFGALAAVGYDGWVTVEDFSTELPLAERTADNLAYLRSLVQPC
ncbi:sugar phosphate isomerase/epimerase family protein [Arthrobacter glacialis]|uniref:Sugar phosphate isomerase/epimerase n=1 Tax=Arthrobacter glacialis TaxID=1664 RepID=A0A2S4A1Q6_ARTGL|nr:sugar phosphate isomerase/epimerase family protein [Arthrobacter glacialis]POH75420.1 sugar phosphate isomerase/epimerase [Arthrobacter glacialis]